MDSYQSPRQTEHITGTGEHVRLGRIFFGDIKAYEAAGGAVINGRVVIGAIVESNPVVEPADAEPHPSIEPITPEDTAS